MRVCVQVQVEVRKKWQHVRVSRFGAFAPRRFAAATTTTYAAVPPSEGVGQTAPQPGQVPLTPLVQRDLVVPVSMPFRLSQVPSKPPVQPEHAPLKPPVLSSTMPLKPQV